MQNDLLDPNFTQIKRSEVGDYIINTILLEKTNALPYYETVIFSTKLTQEKNDSLNGKVSVCHDLEGSKRMHRDAIYLVAKTIRKEGKK